MGKQSVIEARNAQALVLEKQRGTRDALASLENIAGECVAQMFDAIENVNEGKLSSEEATIQLLTTVFPLFTECFEQIISIDPETARICASQFEAFLLGPPKRRTPDPHGFLKIVLNLFHSACEQRI